MEAINKKTYLKNVHNLGSLDKLQMTKNEYVIGASSALIYYGYPKVNEDIDIVATDETIAILLKRKLIKEVINPITSLKAYTSIDGIVDITNMGDGWIDWTKEQWLTRSFVCKEGYRLLTWEGLYVFYKELYGISKKEKHLNAYLWMEKQDPKLKNIVHYDNTTTLKAYKEILNRVKLFFKSLGWSVKLDIVVTDWCVYNNGKMAPPDIMDPLMCAGSHTKAGVLHVGSPFHQRQVYGVPLEKMSLWKFLHWIIAHESAHEVWDKHLNEFEKIQELEKIPEDFTSNYLDMYYTPEHPKYNTEKFCEYIGFLFSKNYKEY